MTRDCRDILDRGAASLVTHGRPAESALSAASRVLWSILAEPGDAVAGLLVAALGAAPSAMAVGDAMDRSDPCAVENLLHRCCAAGAIGVEDAPAVQRALGAALDRWRPRYLAAEPARVIGAAASVGAQLLVPGDDGWPTGVADLGAHAPMVLWARGDPQRSFFADGLAIVGARAATAYGIEVAAEIAARAADEGMTVVSGGAYGIDAVAHRVTASISHPTVAVLAGGIDQLYPAGNIELLHAVVRAGAIIAESPPGTRPTRWRFLARNRLIAAVAQAVVVVEARNRSGALNTANHASELGRRLWAVPGPLTSQSSAGCHRLIAESRADIVTEPSEPSRRHGGADVGCQRLELRDDSGDAPEILRVLDALSKRRSVTDAEVARRSGLSLRDVASALALAELQGRVMRDQCGWRAAPH